MATVSVDVRQEPAIKNILERNGFIFESAPHAFWRARGPGASATFYTSGKLLTQGKEAEAVVALIAEIGLLASGSGVRIGTDEAGKGDYFGPLVVAGVLLDDRTDRKLAALGVTDSKCLSDKRISQLAEVIRSSCPFSVIAIGPGKYNELIVKMHSLNTLMGWAHARVIENILEKHECPLAVSDQFGDERCIKNALQTRGRSIRLVQCPRAESADRAVAAASIVARNEFVSRIDALSREFDLTLPKGASEKVIDAGRQFVRQYGVERLKDVAKIHFRTTQSVI
jgi:ribonuclease HIII